MHLVFWLNRASVTQGTSVILKAPGYDRKTGDFDGIYKVSDDGKRDLLLSSNDKYHYDLVSASPDGTSFIVNASQDQGTDQKLLISDGGVKVIDLGDNDILGWHPGLRGYVVRNRTTKALNIVFSSGKTQSSKSLESLRKVLDSARAIRVYRCVFREDGAAILNLEVQKEHPEFEYEYDIETLIVMPDGECIPILPDFDPKCWMKTHDYVLGSFWNEQNYEGVASMDIRTREIRRIWIPDPPMPFGIAGAPVIMSIASDTDQNYAYVNYRVSDCDAYGELIKLNIDNGRIGYILPETDSADIFVVKQDN